MGWRAGTSTAAAGAAWARAQARPDAALILARNLAAAVGPEDMQCYDRLPVSLRNAIAQGQVCVSARAVRLCLYLGYPEDYLARIIGGFRLRETPDGTTHLVLEA